ncbi:MAG: undecaprenyl-diphosphate phosphatase [Nanoarchaeota archaeon]|nr:undecaprenyl-diphosphate phosphatase [Nanoarchaeota archaeon]
MLIEILLAVIQAATEFLPVSSSGHLALFSNIIEKQDLFFFTVLHLASLFAVMIFTRKEIFKLISFEKKYKKYWVYLITASLPAVFFGFIFLDLIETSFSSFLFLGLAFIFTGTILFLTKYAYKPLKLNFWSSLFIGLFQALALFPGISRSGMTISSGLFSGLNKEEAVKFSFLLFVPLSIGAFVLKLGSFYFSYTLLLSFFICLFLSWFFLNLLYIIVKKGKFWMFSLYCFLIGVVSLWIYFF